MKKILAVIFVLCMMTACAPVEPVINENVDTINTVAPIEGEVKEFDDFELLGQYTVADDETMNETSVSLYTSAMRDKKGELMWDDSQEWVLKAENASGTYILYDERINGCAYMQVLNSYNDDGDEAVINLHIYANTYNEIREYRFNGQEFEEKICYTTDETSANGISELYSSIPQYE